VSFYVVRLERGGPWPASGMLRPAPIERWTVVLDGRGLT